MTDYHDDFQPVSEPLGISILSLLGVLNGILAMLLGVFLVLDRNDAALLEETQLSSTQMTAVGVGALIGGAIHVVLAIALGRGSQIVRILYAVVALLNASAAFWAVIGTHGEQRVVAAITFAFGLIVVRILFLDERTERYFQQSR